MSKETVEEKSKAICCQILNSLEYKKAEVILGYYPLGNEVNCLPVLLQALEDGKKLTLPKTAEDGQMDFYVIHSIEEVEEGNFHVMEPKQECSIFFPETAEYEEVLVLVPGVVFDKEGNRYGYGRGYYDRYFARFPKLKRMALAYTEQMSDEKLVFFDTDIKRNGIITETLRINVKGWVI